MQHEEALKKIEPKQDSEQSGQNQAQALFLPDRKKIEQLIARRQDKLEQIKSYIPLKTYNALREKLALEQQQIAQKIDSKERQIKQNSRAQTLSKVFFEQRPLKTKTIRIN